MRMADGESLLYTSDLSRARNYLEAAHHEGDLSTPARIITDRLVVTAEYLFLQTPGKSADE